MQDLPLVQYAERSDQPVALPIPANGHSAIALHRDSLPTVKISLLIFLDHMGPLTSLPPLGRHMSQARIRGCRDPRLAAERRPSFSPDPLTPDPNVHLDPQTTVYEVPVSLSQPHTARRMPILPPSYHTAFCYLPTAMVFLKIGLLDALRMAIIIGCLSCQSGLSRQPDRINPPLSLVS